MRAGPPSHEEVPLNTRSRTLPLAAALTLALTALGSSTARAKPEAYKVDLVHSSLIFKIKHLGIGWVYGRFNEFQGEFSVDEENPANSRVRIEVDAESIDTANADRDKHLRNPDFFDVAEHPKITFKSTAVAKTPTGALEVKGEVTLLGVAKPATLTLHKVGAGQDPWGNHRIGFEGTFTVRRSQHGMNYGIEQGALGDEVFLTLAIQGIRQ
jgi:polyisoprenoid-binding protein YceI